MTATSDAPAAPAPSSTVPVRADGLELLGPLAGSGYQRQPWLVRRADGQTLQMTPLLYAVLAAVDGQRNDAEIAQVVGVQVGRSVAADDIRYLIEERLHPLGVLQADDGSQPAVARSNPLLALRWRVVVSNPRVTRRITAPFATLFRPYVVLPMLVAFALISGWLLLDKGLASATHQALYQPGVLLLIFGLTILSAGFHEFGHAAACRYGGATPGAMGVGLYLVWPAFYTEVSDCYRLGRWGRLRVDVGGLYFNAIFAVGMLGVWAATGWDALLLVIPAQLLQMLRQLLPFVRFDGYHILADLTGVPDLFAHIKPTLQGFLPRRRRAAQRHALKRWARVVVTTWVLLVIPVLLASLVLMIKVLPRIAVTAWDSLGQQHDVLLTNWADGAWTDVGVRLLSMFTIALPLASITYLLARIIRRTSRRLWRATQGRPRLRAAAMLAAVAAAGVVGWLWWPQGQYEPIQADERGTLLDPFLPVAQQASPSRLLALAQLGAPHAVAGGAPVQVAQPAATFHQLPSSAARPVVDPVTGERAEPRLGLVLVPRTAAGQDADTNVHADRPRPLVLLAPDEAVALSGDVDPTLPDEVPAELVEQAGLERAAPAPTPAAAAPAPAPAPAPADAGPEGWVFPFSEPREAREQDNQAAAINTQDGAVVYDVSFAIVWVTDGEVAPVDHRNDAYALASCRSCGTVAVAFQVVLVVGQADVVAPQNVSMAVNYDCVECSTYALAVQLVATLTRTPSDAAMAEIEALWVYARQVEAQIEDLPLNQIHAELVAIEAAILQVLDADGAGPVVEASTTQDGEAEPLEAPATPTPSASASATASATPPVGGSPSPSASPSMAASPTTSPSPSPSPSASPSPKSSRSASPSPASTAANPSSEGTEEPSPPAADATDEPAGDPTEPPSDGATEQPEPEGTEEAAMQQP